MTGQKQHFFTILLQSITPSGYRKLRDIEPLKAASYVIVLVLFSMLLKMVFAIPLAIDMYDSMQNASSKFSKASFQGALKTNEPILIPEKNPLIQIDTSPEAKRVGEVFITGKEVIYGKIDSPSSVAFPDFSEAAAKEEVKKGVLLLVALIMPSVIILLFLGVVIKAALIALIMGTIAFSIGSYRKMSQSYPSALALALYSTTAMVLIEAAAIPLRLGSYLFPIFSILGMKFYLASLCATFAIFMIWFVISGSEKYAYS